jgi:hypothetical protein
VSASLNTQAAPRCVAFPSSCHRGSSLTVAINCRWPLLASSVPCDGCTLRCPA